MHPPYVAVVGAGDAGTGDTAIAEQLGHRLARIGAIVVCGGSTGVMEAVCRGAKAASGTTVGILPGPDREDANAWVDVALPTGLGELRNGLVVRAADVVVAIGGEFGTLSEIAFALKTGVPVVGLGTWQLTKPGQAVDDAILRADDVDAALDHVVRLLGR